MGDVATSAAGGSKLALQLAILVAFYVGISWIGLRMTPRYGESVLIFCPTSVSLAVLLLHGPRFWPLVFIGESSLGLIQGLSGVLAIATATGFTFEAAIGSMVLTRHLGFRPALDRVRDVVALLVVGGVGASLIGATWGVTALWLAGDLDGNEYAGRLIIWWRAGFGRIVSITPFLLLLLAGRPRWPVLLTRSEFWLVSALFVITSHLAFGDVATPEFNPVTTQLPLLCVIWAGARLGTRGAGIITFATIVAAAVATRNGTGPFGSEDLSHSISHLFIYSVGLAIIGPMLAAAIAQRDRAEIQSYEDAADRLRAERERELLRQRERIMREMHDGLGGQLVSVLSMVQRGQARSEEIAEGLGRALDEMRIMLDSFGASRESLPRLLGELRTRLDLLLKRNGLELVWRVEEGAPLDAVDPEPSLHCLRIIQEAVSNSIQHARASCVRIAIASEEDDASRLSIEVSDDGPGGEADSAHRGQGVKNMLARARLIGGEIRFDVLDPGHRVRLTLPVAGMAD